MLTDLSSPGVIRLLLLLLVLPCLAQAQAQFQPRSQAGIPTLDELEAAGARIGTIRVITNDIFDTSDPREDNALFRLANTLHIRTRPRVVRSALLFRSGELLSADRIRETERLLRSNRYLYDVAIEPVAWNDGVVDFEVRTRDTWSLNPGVKVGRSGGTNTSGFEIEEYNLLGTGASLSWGRSNTVDRSTNTFRLAADRIAGTWTSVDLSTARNSDGDRHAVSVTRPFYALDTRWAAGLSALRDDHIDPLYTAGRIVNEFRHKEHAAEVWAGWSPGLIDSWVQRFSIGANLAEHRYGPEPGRDTPAVLPPDERLAGPFLRYELLEDRYQRLHNRNLIARPEFFSFGLALQVQLGWALPSWGSDRRALLYSASLSKGFEPAPGDMLMTSATLSGRYIDGQIRRQRIGAQAQYYLPQGRRWVFYGGIQAEALSRPQPTETLLLGGDNGLRGYPLRYQAGTRSAILTLEERFFTDIFLWRLFRIGGAAFFDVGRAWKGELVNETNPGWLRNVGFGLRIANMRSSFDTVLHVDIAFPIDRAGDVRRAQFLVRTKTSF